MSCANYLEDGESKEENWKAYNGKAENFVSYDNMTERSEAKEVQMRKKAAAEEELSYKQNRPIDGEIQYWNGKIITHHEAPLEDGLLGFTNTESFVYVTTANKYGHSKQQILDHEHLHILHPDWDEYTLRTVTDHNASVDIGLEERESEKKNNSVYV